MIAHIKLQEHWLNNEAASESEACKKFIISCLNEVYLKLKPLNYAWIG